MGWKEINGCEKPANRVNDGSFYGHLLSLPSGQILFADYSTDVELYTPAGTYTASWAPVVASVPTTLTHGKTYTASGTQFAGVSQGGAYGDDYQPYTNYALARITNNSTKHVFYCKTHDPTSYALQSTATQSTNFDVPAGIEKGASTFVIVTNGIPSAGVAVTVKIG